MNSKKATKKQSHKLKKYEPKRSAKKAILNSGYLSSLKGFWEGRPHTAIERLSEILAQDPFIDETNRLYRLWIEILVDSEELASLSDLDEHLSYRCSTDTDSAITFMALRGIIQFELDKFDAAKLMLKSIARNTNNPYVAELSMLCQQRTEAEANVEPLLDIYDNLTDYFHLQTLARGLVLKKDSTKLNQVIKKIRANYPDSPLPDFFQLHRYIENNNFHRAYDASTRLVQRYPGNYNFGFLFGYLSILTKEYEQAIHEFQRLNSLHGKFDPDAFSFLGYSLAEIAIREDNHHYKEEAQKTLLQAIEICKQTGRVPNLPNQQLRKLNKKFGELYSSDTEERQPKVWLVKLPANKFHEIKTAPMNKIKNIRKAMGESVKKGDWCFFVGDHYEENSTKWRLAALYMVSSDPTWHPLHMNQNTLTLINRPEFSIPIEFESKDSKSSSETQSDIFELDGSAVDIINETLEEYACDEGEIKDMVTHLQQAV